MTKDGALEMCLEYIETNALERRFVRWAIKEALAHDDEDAIIIQYHEATIKILEKRIEELTAQPEQRQPLTDEQIRAASLQAGMQEHYMGFHSGFIRFTRAIEAAHNIGAK